MNSLVALVGEVIAREDVYAYLTGTIIFVLLFRTCRFENGAGSQIARSRMMADYRKELELRATLNAGRGQAKRPRRSRLYDLFEVSRSARVNALRAKLASAGMRSRSTMSTYALVKTLSPIICMITAQSTMAMLGILPELPSLHVVVLVLAVASGFFVPDVYLINIITKRRQALQKALPDVLDIMVVCAEAGLSLDATIERVSEEIALSSREFADELALTRLELNFFPDRRQALANLGDRCGLPSIRGVINTLVQTEKYGTPLAQSLRVLAAESRDERMLKAEEKAARLPAIMTVPMIVFILPALFIILIGPALLDVYDNIIK